MRGMRKGKENPLTQDKKKGEDLSGEGPGRAGDQQQTDRVMTAAEPRASGRSSNIYREGEPITSPGPGERWRPTRGPLSPLPFPPQVSFPRSFGASRLHGWRRPTSFPGRLTVCPWIWGDRLNEDGAQDPISTPVESSQAGECPRFGGVPVVVPCRAPLSSMQQPRQSNRQRQKKQRGSRSQPRASQPPEPMTESDG